MVYDPLDADRRGQVNADVGFSHELVDESRVLDGAPHEFDALGGQMRRRARLCP